MVVYYGLDGGLVVECLVILGYSAVVCGIGFDESLDVELDFRK